MPQNLSSLLVVAAVAVAAPIVADYLPGVRVPVVVLELVLGIVVGPQVLELAKTGSSARASPVPRRQSPPSGVVGYSITTIVSNR